MAEIEPRHRWFTSSSSPRQNIPSDPPSDGRCVCARAAFAVVLPHAATSLLMTPTQPGQPPFLVLGTSEAEVIFDPIDDLGPFQCKVSLKSSSPISALAYGSLTGRGNNEVVAICADGFLQCINPPQQGEAATVVFSQLIQANITAACVLDVDNDGNHELVVIMTDRVLRTFRWNPLESRLIPVSKWEVPSQISALSLGESSSSLRCLEAWISQLGSSFYVSLPLSEQEKDKVRVEHPATKDHSTMVMPYRSYFVHVMGTLINNIIIIVNGKERTLYNPGWPIISACTIRLPSFNIVASLDLRGLVLLYGFNERNVNNVTISPLLRINSLSDSERLGGVVTSDTVFLAVANTEGRVIVHAVPISTIKKEMNSKN